MDASKRRASRYLPRAVRGTRLTRRTLKVVSVVIYSAKKFVPYLESSVSFVDSSLGHRLKGLARAGRNRNLVIPFIPTLKEICKRPVLIFSSSNAPPSSPQEYLPRF